MSNKHMNKGRKERCHIHHTVLRRLDHGCIGCPVCHGLQSNSRTEEEKTEQAVKDGINRAKEEMSQ